MDGGGALYACCPKKEDAQWHEPDHTMDYGAAARRGAKVHAETTVPTADVAKPVMRAISKDDVPISMPVRVSRVKKDCAAACMDDACAVEGGVGDFDRSEQ